MKTSSLTLSLLAAAGEFGADNIRKIQDFK
jgi:hypothetical protein